jgi:NhaP-type Na+/H+ or K+/H+ antiporter
LTGLAVVAAVFAIYSLVASRLDRLSVTAPIVFLVTGAILGPAGLGWLSLTLEAEPSTLLLELTLAILLFTDASTVSVRDAEEDARFPARLLVLGLPLTIVLGAVLAVLLFPTEGWAMAAVIGVILAPTDAALSLPLVTNTAIPARVRRILNIESGLNDGIATPFLTFFLAVAVAAEDLGSHNWALETVAGIGLAVVAAVVVGGLGGWLLARARRRGWTTAISEHLAVVALALLAYGASTAVGGNGFVAAFAAGIAFRTASGGGLREAAEFGETLGLFGSFLVWVLFGTAVAGPIIAQGLELEPILYAVLSLTVVRMLPVAIALFRSGLRPDTVALVGWFGPRGLASVVFGIIAFEALQGASLVADTLIVVVTWTIVLSVLAHGLSAGPLARLFARRMARASLDALELAQAPEPRQRRRGLA